MTATLRKFLACVPLDIPGHKLVLHIFGDGGWEVLDTYDFAHKHDGMYLAIMSGAHIGAALGLLQRGPDGQFRALQGVDAEQGATVSHSLQLLFVDDAMTGTGRQFTVDARDK